MTWLLLLAEGERRVLRRVQELSVRLDAGDNDAWPEYLAALTVLHALVPPERRPLETTAEVAKRFSISPKTVRRKGRKLGLEPVRIGARGTAAIRWRNAQ